jgi:uncharacterized damage-inducible protein DinB
MQRPEADEYHPNYQKYFDLTPKGEYQQILSRNMTETVDFFDTIPREKHDYRYAEGKWTIKEVLMHIIDTERVFAYRALAAARGDATPIYRMDEELYASNVDVSNRTMSNLVSEFKTVRGATESLFRNMTDEQSKRSCNVVTHPMSARAIGYFMIGHVLHHVGVVRDRYLQHD